MHVVSLCPMKRYNKVLIPASMWRYFGNKVFVDIIKLRRGGRHYSNMTNVLIKRGMKNRDSEEKAMWWRRQRLERCVYNEDCQHQQNYEKTWHRHSSRGFRGNMALPTPSFQTSRLQIVREYIFLVVSSPVCTTKLWQSKEMSITYMSRREILIFLAVLLHFP